MTWEEQFEHDGPHEKWEYDLVYLRFTVVSPEPTYACYKDDNRNEEWDTEQVVEVGVKESVVSVCFEDESIKPVETKGCEEQRISKVKKWHRSMAVWNMQRKKDGADQ